MWVVASCALVGELGREACANRAREKVKIQGAMRSEYLPQTVCEIMLARETRVEQCESRKVESVRDGVGE